MGSCSLSPDLQNRGSEDADIDKDSVKELILYFRNR